MSQVVASIGPRFTRVPRLVAAFVRPLARALVGLRGMHSFASREGAKVGAAFRARLAQGDTVYLLGLTPASHNTGVALIECHPTRGARVLANLEEERFSGEKHSERFPTLSLDQLASYFERLGCTADDIHCVLTTWDYVDLISNGTRTMLEHAPASFGLMREGASIAGEFSTLVQALSTAKRLAKSGPLRNRRVPIIMMTHHENHAYHALASSPFAHSDKPTLIMVLDGFGDNGSVSVYLARKGEVERLYCNRSLTDSLGIMYGMVSSTQGGWTLNSSEGRYMGAAAWGDQNRLRNRFYRPLRELIHLSPNGEVLINRKMAGWHLAAQDTPYLEPLTAVLGPAIAREKMWNPDVILNVDDIVHAEITRERVDKAAALQMVFEDGLFHAVDHWLRKTKAEELLLTGGTALNCVANMRLMEHFDDGYYEQQLGKKGRLSLWVSPTPGDAGTPMGAALQFAMRNGVSPAKPCVATPYLCGNAAPRSVVQQALAEATLRVADSGGRLEHVELGDCEGLEGRRRVARLIATAVAAGGVVGIFQGPAETGPRALGNRSILANPCDPNSLALLNAKVKYRERVRPLAPMLTAEAARDLFELAPGAEDYDLQAYEYMVLTVRARQKARDLTPAIVHEDGTSRIQVVRPQQNSLIYEYLKQMGELVGVEVSVNTSLNVGSPIVQTPAQALQVLQKARAMDGLFMIADDHRAVVAWIDGVRPSGDVSRMPEWLEQTQQRPLDQPHVVQV